MMYVKAGQPPKADEWKASVVLTDEDQVEEFEDFVKEVDAKVSLKKVKTAEFEKTYKCEPPADAGKNVWVVTLRKSTELGKTGKPVPDLYKPKVFEKVGRTLVDITNTKLPANGSFGAISIDQFDRNNGTASLYLKNVLVTDLIEYIPEESDYEAGSEFGDEDETPAPKAKAAKATKAEQVEEESSDESEGSEVEEQVSEAKTKVAAKPVASKPKKTGATVEDSDLPF